MRWIHATLSAVLSFGLIGLAADTARAGQSTATKTEVRPFQVVWVDGNKVIVRGDQGAQEITVPDDFRFDVDGRQVSVRELKPGMKGTATITTRTTSTPVHVTEVREARVMQVAGNSIIVRGPDGFRRFTEADVRSRNVQMIRNGRPAAFRDFRAGDNLTATIITEGPPEVVTEREVQASLNAPAPAAAPARVTKSTTVVKTPRAAEAPATAAAPSAAATSARRLPSTASPLPLIGLLGFASLALGTVLTIRRRRKARKTL
jgi:LPXTG-motif cell wall-anchored protein